ncbi:CaiB/BaiF CoA transferase family protein [Cupriavidus oxalaticus]|uniref:CoA transferase n=1 Tax=Cupriavidus oxalaticus TaxID=96344 RepID=A0ABX7HLI8_9BURK|nr:CaiB/BaiF CoA-transferase family protein [Cupriavidus oxalaticus]QRQ84925.1 CoA transferase [Cupriavidus oxalaticus]QRQ90986.1 CoA transferase [Cupriavidus oxalaticus]WQD85519.1 CaiB/BaiF CoA-transferase family protein [Cupriavidus oxalaticus]
MVGPLAGVRIVELAGIGPAPFCAMLLADLGATIIRVDRKEPSGLGLSRPLQFDLVLRNRKSIQVDLKDPAELELVRTLIDKADALIEGFRPGVTERLGLGPDACLARNPRLVYGRLTGWGQDGPLAQTAGHDINYIAITGLLNAIGREGEPPTVPLNVVGDYAGGSVYAALGIVSAILEARASGKGQVVDAAIVDGVASLLTVHTGLRAAGLTGSERGTNLLDSGAPFYDVYECADGKYISIGPIEAKFYQQLLERLELDPSALGKQADRADWPAARRLFAAQFKTRTRAQWTELLEGSDVCFAPVLDQEEAFEHPHLKARGTFVEVDGVMQPRPAPRFSRTRAADPVPPAAATPENAALALAEWLTREQLANLAAAGRIQNGATQ